MSRKFEVVEKECINCGLCVERAPENFEMPAGCAAKVVKQPENEQEEEACMEASEFCPMGGLQPSTADAPPTQQTANGRR